MAECALADPPMNEVAAGYGVFRHSVAVFSLVRHRDAGFLFASINDAAMALLGADSQRALGGRLDSVVEPTLAALLHSHALECLESRQPVVFSGPGGSGGVYFMTPLGKGSSLISVTSLPKAVASRLPLILEEQARLASVGRLARGVAHDVNNVMGAALLSLTSALRASSEQSVVHQRLALVENALKLSTLLLRKVLSVANERSSEVDQVHLSEVVSDVVNLVRPHFPRNVDLCLEFAAEVRPIRGVRSELMQMVLNLCLNALHATETNSGSVELSVTEKHLSSPLRLGRRELRVGDYSCLCVADSGQGMSAQTLARALDPFFTTHKGGGTGLGLSIVSSVVEAHGGGVSIQSTLGAGTTVLVYLPIHP